MPQVNPKMLPRLAEIEEGAPVSLGVPTTRPQST